MSPEAKLLYNWLLIRDYESIKSWAAVTNGTTVMCVMVEAMVHIETPVDITDFDGLAEEMGVI